MMIFRSPPAKHFSKDPIMPALAVRQLTKIYKGGHQIDEAFRHNADAGRRRFLEGFGWLLDDRHDLADYARLMEQSKTIQSLKEIGKLVLAIPAFVSDPGTHLIREVMESIRTIDVDNRVDTHLGKSMLARRRNAFMPPACDTKIA